MKPYEVRRLGDDWFAIRHDYSLAMSDMFHVDSALQ